MLMIPPVAIDDTTFVSSTVPDSVEVAEVKATGTITVGSVAANVQATGSFAVNSLPTAGQTFVVGPRTFTFVASGSAAGQVIIGGNTSQTATNMATSINRDIPGTVSAAQNSSNCNITAHATNYPGASGNAIAFSESIAPLVASPSGGYLSGGVTAVPTLGETFVVGSQTFTIVASGTATGNVVRDTSSVSGMATNIKTSIDRDIPGVVSVSRSTGVLTLTAKDAGAAGNAVVLTEAVSGIAASGSGYLTGGLDAVAGTPEYSSGTTYAVGNVVVVTSLHRLYESLRATNINNYPPDNLTGVNPYWLDLGATNRWRMFDTTVSSQTSQAESIVVVLTPGAIDTVALLNCTASSITIDLTSGGISRYSQTIATTSTAARNYIKTDIPDEYPSGTLTVTIANTGGNATCGFLLVGLQHDIGKARYGIEAGIIDYSIKQTDAFGNMTIVQRSYAKRATFPVGTPTPNHSEVKRLLTQYRAQPALWVGKAGYSLLMLFGFTKSWEINVGSHLTDMSLEIEGLV